MEKIFISCCGASILKDGNDPLLDFRTNNKDGWVTLAPCEHDDSFQVIPVDDARQHIPKGADCWCEPEIKFEDNAKIVVHSAKDKRE